MPQKAKWYEIKAAAGSGRDQVFIFGDIADVKWDDSIVTAKEFIGAIKGLGDFELRINSRGGSVWAGNAIYNALVRHPGEVDVYIEGLAASIASVVAMGGKRVHMPANAMLMIHKPWSFVEGSAEEMRVAAEMLDKATVGLVSAYQEKTGLDPDKIEQMMSSVTWMTASEAVELGFADDIVAPVQMAASFDLSCYRNVPNNLRNQPPVAEAQPAQGGSPMPTIDSLKKDHPEVVANIEAAARQGMIAQADHDAALAAGRQEVLDLHAAVFGEEAGKQFAAIVASGVNAAQAKALGVSVVAGKEGDADLVSRQGILAALQAAAPGPLHGAPPENNDAAARSATAKAIADGGSVN